MAESLKYFSTNHNAPLLTFEDALIKGLAHDKGLFMPEELPCFSSEEIEQFSHMEYHEIAYSVFKKFLRDDIPDETLKALAKDAYDFAVPLEHVEKRKYVMRLDQGPTASFKDFAARMMGRWMQYFLRQEKRKIVILTATSGDTGSAMANAFYGLDNVSIVVLFPKDEVTERQRKQMTTLHGNVKVLGLDAKFDDCQALVKEAFSDPDLEYMNLSSANSINIGRLLPQIVYYIYSYSQLRKEKGEEAIFCVPSGNFGDMMGGVLAMHMGLPVKRFLVATNENDEFPKLLQTKKYSKIEPSRNCLSSAMNVGHPSNLARLVELYGGNMDEKGNIHKQPDFEKLEKDFYTKSVTDEETKQAIAEAYKAHSLLLEPHGAVGWHCLEEYLKDYPEDQNRLIVTLETAHPAKFPDSVVDILKIDPELPDSLKGLEGKEEKITEIEKDYPAFKQFLKQNF